MISNVQIKNMLDYTKDTKGIIDNETNEKIKSLINYFRRKLNISYDSCFIFEVNNLQNKFIKNIKYNGLEEINLDLNHLKLVDLNDLNDLISKDDPVIKKDDIVKNSNYSSCRNINDTNCTINLVGDTATSLPLPW